MGDPLTREQLAEIERVTDAATPPRWYTDGSRLYDVFNDNDAEFIAMARTAIPDLLETLRVRDEEITELRAALEAIVSPPPVPEPDESTRTDSYGNYACGCSWDSGPYEIHCNAHDPDGPRWRAIEVARVLLARGDTEP